MFRKKKLKGFTLVELLVVIAIIAILATVSVVGYLSFTKKAKESNDTSMVTQMNTILEATEVSDGSKNTTAYGAFQDLEANGITVDNLQPYSSGYKYAWNSQTDRMVLLNDSGSVVSGEGSDANSDLFVPVDSVDELNNYTGNEEAAVNENVVYADSSNPFSVYLTTKFDVTTVTGGITVKAGIDTGKQEVTNITVEYTGTANIVVRTDSKDTIVTIESSGSVNHYGEVGNVTVSASVYTESGAVSGSISASKGEIKVEATATVSAGIIITSDKVTVKAENTSVNVNATDASYLSNVTGGTTGTTTLVKTLDELTTAVAAGGHITLGEDITTITDCLEVSGTSTINLNGHTLSGTHETYTLFYVTGTLTLDGCGQINHNKGICEVTGKLTVKSGTYTVSENEKSPLQAFYAYDSGEIVIEDCDVTTYSDCCVALIGNGKATINGGTFTCYDNFVIGTNGGSGCGGNTITINGGTFNGYIETSGYVACGIYVANSDTVTINGGTFNITNGVGVLMRGGITTIGKDVVFNMTNDGEAGLSGQVGDNRKISIPVNATLVTDHASGYPDEANLTCTNNSSYALYNIALNETEAKLVTEEE